MAKRSGKSPSRLDKRREVEAAEALEEKKPKAAKATKKKATKKKTTRKKTKSTAAPERLRMVWGVFDNSNQQVAAFPYPDKAAAEKKIEDLAGKGRGPYFIQPVKEAIIEPEPEEAEAAEEA